MGRRPTLLEALGGEAGCRRLSTEFYARVAKDPVLRPLFPGKTLRCAIEEFGAFLIQFLGGDEEQTQYRWWLSLRESHARFRIQPAQRGAWIKQMSATLEASTMDPSTRQALRQLFLASSGYLIGKDDAEIEDAEAAARWGEQRVLDDTIAAIAAGRDQDAIALSQRFVERPAVMIGLLARMAQSRRPELIQFAAGLVEREPFLRTRRFAGRTLLHFAAAAGCLPLVTLLLRIGADPNAEDAGGHTPLYRVANECAWPAGPDIVRALVQAGADVNASGGVTRATALHMAARRGHTQIAQTLLDCGAAINVQDTKGDTPLQRAINCRKPAVVELLMARGASTRRNSKVR